MKKFFAVVVVAFGVAGLLPAGCGGAAVQASAPSAPAIVAS